MPPAERESGSAFRWPSRELASRSERQAAVAAQRALERLRARGKKLRARPSLPPKRTAAPPPPTAREPAEPPDRPAEPARAPIPWHAELDALTEELVAELRRDLGPRSAQSE